jgi:hypothetical protein
MPAACVFCAAAWLPASAPAWPCASAACASMLVVHHVWTSCRHFRSCTQLLGRRRELLAVKPSTVLPARMGALATALGRAGPCEQVTRTRSTAVQSSCPTHTQAECSATIQTQRASMQAWPHKYQLGALNATTNDAVVGRPCGTVHCAGCCSTVPGMATQYQVWPHSTRHGHTVPGMATQYQGWPHSTRAMPTQVRQHLGSAQRPPTSNGCTWLPTDVNRT